MENDCVCSVLSRRQSLDQKRNTSVGAAPSLFVLCSLTPGESLVFQVIQTNSELSSESAVMIKGCFRLEEEKWKPSGQSSSDVRDLRAPVWALFCWLIDVIKLLFQWKIWCFAILCFRGFSPQSVSSYWTCEIIFVSRSFRAANLDV